MSWSRFLHRGRWDDERAKELRDYLDHEIDDNIARGMPPDEAARAAHRKLGNATRIREDIYDMNTLRFFDALWRDLRYGLRLLRRNPTFSIVAILTLALGTGANAAIFQLVNAVRLRTLPVERPEELMSIGIKRGGGRMGLGYRGRSIHTEPIWDALRAEQQAFSSVIAWGTGQWDLSTEGEQTLAQGYYVSGSYFDGLGVRPHVGRLLSEADDRKGCGAPAAVLSHAFWQSRYGGNPAVVGQTIMIDRRPFEIAGVTPPQFFGVEVGRSFDVAIPMCAEPMIRPRPGGRHDVWWLDIMGRLKPDWTPERAGAHLEAISPGIFKATLPPTYNAEAIRGFLANKFTVTPVPTGVSNLRTRYATPLWVLLATTGIVLLITCANLANLMLARASARDREIAVRLAIGASRGRVVRQLLSESLVIAALGAAGGFLLAQWLSRALVGYLNVGPNQVFVDLAPDWRVFGFITLIAAVACLAFGLSPALKATRTDPGKTMHEGGRSTTDALHALTLRRGLVVVQVALSMVLVVGAVLFGRTLRNLTTVDLGFQSEGIVAASLDLRQARVSPEGRAAAFERIVTGLRGVPGVQVASEAFIVPLSGSGWNGKIVVDGVIQPGMVNFNQVGGEYFHALGMKLVEGRTFGDAERPGAPLAAIVNEAFAKKHFPGRSPVGQTFQDEPMPQRAAPVYHVVGVVTNTKYTELRENVIPIAYLAWSQEPQPPPFVAVIIRSSLPFESMRAGLTKAVVEAVPGAAVSYDSLSRYVTNSAATERLMASLTAFFGILATIIASIGLYGVMAYAVVRRKVEIGIRMALGAEPATVIRMILRESSVLLAAGVVIGVGLAAFAFKYARTLLFGLEPSDPVSFLAAAGALCAISLVAAWVPARRASRLAPTLALRE